MQVNINQIAEDLLKELDGEVEHLDFMKVGVKLLFQRIKIAVELEEKNGNTQVEHSEPVSQESPETKKAT